MASIHMFGAVDPKTGRAVAIMVPAVGGKLGDQAIKWFESDAELRSELSRITRYLETAGVADLVGVSGPGSL